jgi:hypothetical protein
MLSVIALLASRLVNARPPTLSVKQPIDVQPGTPELTGDAEVAELADAPNGMNEEDRTVLFFRYMFSHAGPPQYWFEFAAQVMVHEPLADAADPLTMLLPQ